ncbi:acyl-CoA dehydrogenase family protein [Sciscionella marina]|uniref:acyl-CoA dehydrogenase family protein n=1 Tax=Sciscionella marina TaxID=508770 RepID=UPI0006858788|nr:acyl-CoA dehydrogenase family protein [Sciscionella marina]
MKSSAPEGSRVLRSRGSEEENMLREAVSGIAAEFGPVYYRRVCATGAPARELWEALAERGFLGVHLPERYGGGGRGLRELTVIMEETAASGCPMLLLMLSPGIIGMIVNRHGTPRQKDRWLPGVADGSLRFSFALTEPDAGSNSHNICTTARREGDRYVVNGQKCFISGANDCDEMMVVTRTGSSGEQRGRFTILMIDPKSPGLAMQPVPAAPQIPEQQFTVNFDDVHVPVERRIGDEGNGLRVAFDGMNPERILSSALSSGIGRWALKRACQYARTRRVWPSAIGAHQAIAHPLAEAKVRLEQARLMTNKAAALYDAGSSVGESANIAKFASAEAGVFALDRAIQTHGGNGVASDYDLSSFWFLARLQLIAPVSRESVLNYVAEHSLDLPRSY